MQCKKFGTDARINALICDGRVMGTLTIALRGKIGVGNVCFSSFVREMALRSFSVETDHDSCAPQNPLMESITISRSLARENPMCGLSNRRACAETS
jgi:hypothetical protein